LALPTSSSLPPPATLPLPSPLPPVTEEEPNLDSQKTVVEEENSKDDSDAASIREARRLSQVEIDSKVYALTVLPLADVTDAYGNCSSPDGLTPAEAAPKPELPKVSFTAVPLECQC
jgi:hypothetical protein